MEETKKTKFILTGFGKFNGVADNPTTHLMKNILSFIDNQKNQDNKTYDFEILSNDVLEVSTVGSLNSLYEIKSNYTDPNESITIIHFGVSSNSTTICLEKSAYNVMDFRVPDELGFSPVNEKIDLESPDVLSTDLFVDSLVNDLSCNYKVAPSIDPGRFICNYIYYHSLKLSNESNGRFKSLFVHVPTFSVVPLDELCKFVIDLLSLLSK